MFRIILLPIFLVVLAGCAATQEFPYVDHEFGMAQNDAFDQQVAYKDYRYANSKSADMPGIHAEKIMDAYQNSFDRNADNTMNFSRGSMDINVRQGPIDK